MRVVYYNKVGWSINTNSETLIPRHSNRYDSYRKKRRTARFDSQSKVMRSFNYTLKLLEVHRMPIYEYACGECSEVFSVFQSIHAAEKDNKCPKCGSVNVKKQMSSFSCCSVGGGASSTASSGGFSGG